MFGGYLRTCGGRQCGHFGGCVKDVSDTHYGCFRGVLGRCYGHFWEVFLDMLRDVLVNVGGAY